MTCFQFYTKFPICSIEYYLCASQFSVNLFNAVCSALVGILILCSFVESIVSGLSKSFEVWAVEAKCIIFNIFTPKRWFHLVLQPDPDPLICVLDNIPTRLAPILYSWRSHQCAAVPSSLLLLSLQQFLILNQDYCLLVVSHPVNRKH